MLDKKISTADREFKEFCKGIKEMDRFKGQEDCLLNVIDFNENYSKIRVVNIVFDLGYELCGAIKFKYKNDETIFELSSPEYKRSTIYGINTVEINDVIYFNGDPITLKTNLNNPFKLTLFFEYIE
jgi:hypothetical protein